MKRKYEIITSILVVIIIIGALIFAGRRGTLKSDRSLFNWNNTVSSKNEETIKEFTPNDGVVKFNLDIPNTSLEVISTTEKNVKIECISYGESKYYIKQNGNNVVIQKDEDLSIFNWNEKGGKVKILIPTGILSSYYADMSNGQVSISNIDIEDIDIETSNGNVDIENLNVNNDIIIESSNGRINVNTLVANNIEFDSSNGEVLLENIDGKDINVDTSNGRINVNQCWGEEIELNTSNAEIKAFECYGREVVLDTSNGDITLENLEDKEFVIDKLKVSTSNAEENINANYKSKK